MSNVSSILGIEILSGGRIAARSEIIHLLKSEKRSVIYTPNASILALANKSRRFNEVLRSATLLLPDGIGVVLASYASRSPIRERVTGIDTARWLMKICADRGLSVALIGGKEGVAERAAESLRHQLPRLRIVFTHHGYFSRSHITDSENAAVISAIRAAAPDILFVGLGAPAQEAWIYKNADKLPSVKLFMGLGGALDVWSGDVRRAPHAVQALGLEWLWRCIIEPKRFCRLAPIPSLYFKIIRDSLTRSKSRQ